MNKDQLSKKWLLFWFNHFLSIPDDLLKDWIDMYNEGILFDEAKLALEAIDQMSG